MRRTKAEVPSLADNSCNWDRDLTFCRCGNCARLNLVCRPPDLFRTSNTSRSTRGTAFQTNSSTDLAAFDDFEPWDITNVVDCFGNNGNDFDYLPLNSISSSTSPEATEDSQSQDELSMPLLDELPHPWVPPLAPPDASLLERYLLDHYIQKASTVLINVEGPSNPLRSVLIPRAITSQILMDALYAVAAYHVFVCNHDASFRASALKYYNRAASALSRGIAGASCHMIGEDLEVLLLTSVFLCKYEIISVGKNWRQHLQGVQKMLDVFKNGKSTMAPVTLSYIQSL